jgi:molybdate transport system substrate-binding protein
VKGIVSRVSLGEADAGVVYTTDVRAAGNRFEGVDIPESENVVARYPIAVLKDAPDRRAAEAFVGFVTGSEGQAILARYGFLLP